MPVVLILNEFPESCDKCPCYDIESDACQAEKRLVPDECISRTHEYYLSYRKVHRPDWCPLKESASINE